MLSGLVSFGKRFKDCRVSVLDDLLGLAERSWYPCNKLDAVPAEILDVRGAVERAVSHHVIEPVCVLEVTQVPVDQLRKAARIAYVSG